MGFSLEQEKAISLLGSGVKWTDKKLADKLKVSKAKVAEWKKDKDFRVAVVNEFEKGCRQEQLYRFNEVRKLIRPIFKELRRRVKNKNGLRDISTKDLIFILTKIQSEIRTDLEHLNIVSKKGSGDNSIGAGSDIGSPIGLMSFMYLGERENPKGFLKYLQ